ncbi:MAG: PRC-barrel domain-containing protein [Nitrococcus mobilis]|nr:PRC-barrel domain-containing protein [Nitrococcus mobilis]
MQMTRIISLLFFGALGLSVAGSIFARQVGPREQGAMPHAVPMSSEPVGIVGKRVSNATGDNLGVVTNVLIDPASGRVAALVAGIGGVFGYGAYNYEVPWQRVRLTEDYTTVLLNVPRDMLSAEFPAYKPPSHAHPTPQIGEPKSSGRNAERGSEGSTVAPDKQ